jgi:hypothetical protein
MARLTPEQSWYSPEGRDNLGLAEPSSSHSNGRTPMDTSGFECNGAMTIMVARSCAITISTLARTGGLQAAAPPVRQEREAP